MMTFNVQDLTSRAEEYFVKETLDLTKERINITLLDRSPEEMIKKATRLGLGGKIFRAIAAHVPIKLPDLPFDNAITDFISKNLRGDFSTLTQAAFGSFSLGQSQIFSSLSAITGLNPNRALFDIAQRASQDLLANVPGISSVSTQLQEQLGTLRESMSVFVESQGQWFSAPGVGFKENLLTATNKLDGIKQQMSSVMGRLNSGVLPLQQDLDGLRDALRGVREEIVPVDAALRPSAGVDHPQALPLAHAMQMKEAKESIERALKSLVETHERISVQKKGVSNFRSEQNTRVKGATAALELSKTIGHFQTCVDEMGAQMQVTLGGAGPSQVLERQGEWVGRVETMIAVLERPLMNLQPHPEGEGLFDAETEHITTAFDEMSGALAGVPDIDIGPLKEKLNKLIGLSNFSVGASGLNMADVDGLVGEITSHLDDVVSHASSIEGVLNGASFLDGRVPMLDEVTSFLGMLRSSGMDSAEGTLLAGVLYDNGIGNMNIRSVDIRGRLAEKLRQLTSEAGDALESLHLERVQEIHRQLEKKERRRKRLGQGRAEAIGNALEENAFRQQLLAQQQRDFSAVMEQVIKGVKKNPVESIVGPDAIWREPFDPNDILPRNPAPTTPAEELW